MRRIDYLFDREDFHKPEDAVTLQARSLRRLKKADA